MTYVQSNFFPDTVTFYVSCVCISWKILTQILHEVTHLKILGTFKSTFDKV